MYFGYNNPNNTFLLGDHVLGNVNEERDLCVLIQKDLKSSSQCIKVINTANHVLGMIRRRLTYKSKENLLQLYKSFVDRI